ncbi:MAG: PKD repeat protein, partial [Planctomycetota bacterium]
MSRLFLAALLLLGLLPDAQAVQLPSGFSDQLVVSGLASPVAVAFHPDGRLLILEKGGVIQQLLPGQTAVDAVPYLVLSDTESGGERGLLNIALAPDFDVSREFYLYYTSVLSNRNRIVRYTEVAGVAEPASETLIWEDNEPWSSCCHHGGGLAFGPDGLIYATTGEEFDALQAQDPTRSGGKVIRIAPDGTIPLDNPFIDGPGGNDDSVWAMGLRNPFRVTWDLESATMLIGEVGGNTADATEDVHVYHDPDHGEAGHHGLDSGRGGQPGTPTNSALSVRANGPATRGLGTLSPEPGASFQLGSVSPEAVNFGWPSCEGFCGNPFFSDPLFSYPHNGGGAAIIGGYVNRGNQFPAEYEGVYFFADYVLGWIRYLTFDDLGAVATDVDFHVGADQPVFLGQGALGSLYYLELSGDLRRIVYEDGNQAPSIQSVSATPATGPGPTLDVQFTAVATDAESDALTYHWIFGDGQEAFGQTVNHLYTSNGAYAARLEVADAFHTSLSDDLDIAVGSPPMATILAPIDGSSFVGREIIQLMGTGLDPDETLGETSYDWTVTFLHNEHTHPGDGPFLGTSAAAFEISSNNHDFHSNTGFLITLTVTDSDGLQGQDSVSIFPQKVDLTLDTVPSGLTILLDGLPRQTPLVYDTMVGFDHFIETFTPQCLGGSQYAFDSWSDAGDMAHLITVPAIDTDYIANFSSTGNCQVAVPGQIALYTFGEGSGARIHDVSRFGAPLDMTIPDPGAVVWGADGIEIVTPTLIRSEGPATKITTSIRASQEMSFEVWVDPSSLGQSGPARIVTLSDPGIGNAADFMLGQTAGDSFETRLRTLLTNQYGLPALNSGLGTVRTDLVHLVYTRDSSSLASIYLDGALVRSGTIAGAHSSWDTSFELGFGNAFTLDRSWLGSLHLVAFYDRALSPTDVAQNFAAGANGGTNSFPVAVVTTDITQGIAPVTVQFDASTSSDSDGQVVDWFWDFGDGFGALGSIVSHTFTDPGTYDVRVTVTDDFGARSSSFVTITAQAGAPLIVTQPLDSQTMEGQDATFSLVAEGVAPVTFQWRRDGAQISGATADTLIVPGVTQADHLATFDCVVSNGLGEETSNPATLSVLPATGRALNGLVLYYPFDDASGTLVTDQSGFGAASDLVIDDPAAVTWIDGGGLSIDSATRLATALPASKVRTALQASGELTLEVWARPANAVQSGPARIVAYSEDGYPNGGNLILGQSSAFESRLRTTSTNQYGLPGLSSGNGSAGTELTHVLLTRSSLGLSKLHINGALVASNSIGGDLSNWADSVFVVANEPPGDRPWLGEMHLVAVYDRALSDAEIQQNYLFGSGGTPNIPPTAYFTATPSSGVAPLNSSFDAGASDDTDGTIVDHAWDFGDGSTGSGVTLGHLFASSGTYDVTLTVTDDGGRMASATMQVVVSASPVPSFTLQPLNQSRPDGQDATFTVEAEGAMPLAYQWQRDGMDIIGETDPMLIVPNVTLTDDGALFRCTVSNGFGMDTSNAAVLGVIPTSGRISANLLALYQFATGSGDTVLDLSGVQPALDLTIADTSAALWIPGGGIDVQSATQISNSAPASKLNDALMATSEVTLEAWLQSANVSQSGPARVIALSVDGYPNGGNLILGQSSIFEQRLRTTRTRQYGTPGLSSGAGSVTTSLIHYVYTRDVAGNTTLYLDGMLASTGNVAGDFSNWDGASLLALANEPTGDRPWLGKLFLVACFDRALSPGEVLQNFQAGPGITPNTVPSASFSPDVSSGTAPLLVNVDASLSDDPDGVIESYEWDFGDGNSGSGQMAAHTYLASGSFTLALTVTDDFGASDMTSVTIDVTPSPNVV